MRTPPGHYPADPQKILNYGLHVHGGWEWDEDREDRRNWVVMHRDLVAVYTSVLADDFAAANMLQPTTDQQNAYAMANNWTPERITAVLLGREMPSVTPATDELAETLGFLALQLVVPANPHLLRTEKIIYIRQRYGAEFTAFGQAIDEAAAGMASLTDVRDEAILNDYLHDVVTARFAEPLEDLRRKLKALTGDVASLTINVKTQLPSAAALVGGWAAGHPLIGSTAAAAIGLMGIRRDTRQKRDAILRDAPAASFLLQTQGQLKPRTLLDRTARRIARTAGTRPN